MSEQGIELGPVGVCQKGIELGATKVGSTVLTTRPLHQGMMSYVMSCHDIVCDVMPWYRMWCHAMISGMWWCHGHHDIVCVMMSCPCYWHYGMLCRHITSSCNDSLKSKDWLPLVSSPRLKSAILKEHRCRFIPKRCDDISIYMMSCHMISTSCYDNILSW